MKRRGLFFGRDYDIRELPAYAIPEAAHYLCIPKATLRSWVLGQWYQTGGERRFAEAVIKLVPSDGRLLSFINLVEAHVLDAIRRDHKISLQKVRRALEYLAEHLPSSHPLADQRFATDGLYLFVEKYGELINITQQGQLAIRKLIEAHLLRIEHDPKGVPVRLYPFTRKRDAQEPRVVVIDPYISFGRPVLAGTGIATAIIAERFKAGEPVDQLADDYDRERIEIEEAIRCELQLEAA